MIGNLLAVAACVAIPFVWAHVMMPRVERLARAASRHDET